MCTGSNAPTAGCSSFFIWLLLTGVAFLLTQPSLQAQGQFSGDLQLETQFYIRDTTIGASNTEHYDVLKNGGDSWLSLNYLNNDWDLSVGVRFDGFYNSNLHFPGTAFTGIGLGAFYIQKGIGNLDITGGYIYDQFGSGLTFRAFEERTLGIDKALLGARLIYDFNENWSIKTVIGEQKNRFELFKPIIMGANIEGFITIGDKITLSPGFNAVNRTMDKASLDILRGSLQTQLSSSGATDTLLPKSNVHTIGAYTSLDVGKFSWYVEGAYRTSEFNPVDTAVGTTIFQNRDGNVFLTSLTFSQKGLGITGQYRRVDFFEHRTSPNELLLNGIYNYLPTFTRQNSLRLPARYNSVAQDDGEQAYQIDVIYQPIKGYTFSLNASDIRTLDGDPLFREYYFDLEIRKKKNWKMLVGANFVSYDQEFYEAKPDAKVVETVTPFVEFLYKIDRKKSIRCELQYLNTDGDFGSWMYGLLEFNMAPSWSFAVSDMYNYRPTDKSPGQIHYYDVAVAYTKAANRFQIKYARQVEGIVCTGGVCRFEPAFNGVRFGVTSSF